MYNEQTVSQLTNAFLENSRTLAESLMQARDYLETNNLTLIEENNAKNMTTNKTLISIINALDINSALSSRKGNVFDRIQDYAQSLPLNDKDELIYLLDTLKKEFPIYKQVMQVNRTVVYANLKHAKDLFCTIFNKDSINESSLYKPSGLPGSITISLE